MEPDTSHDLDLVSVFEAIGTEAEMEAIAIHSILQASDIPAVLVGSSALPNLPFQVKVPQEHVEQAQVRIKEAKAAGPEAADEAQSTDVPRTPGLIRSSIPTLPALNLEESIASYSQLGFAVRSRNDQYAILTRDHVQIHLFASHARVESGGCYLHTGDIQALHAEFAAAGVERLGDIEEKPWKMVEFEVYDPSGNVLRFGQGGK
ncbi:MAG: VOC family protein [Bryobacterales bacterium]|nr:VOC family protein [Bryobacterales bacterium]